MRLSDKEIEYVIKRESKVFITKKHLTAFEDSKKKRNMLINKWLFDNPFHTNTEAFNEAIFYMIESNLEDD